jgi:hypothetical protein
MTTNEETKSDSPDWRPAVGAPEGMTLVSFDIDGTLETGDPPGPLSASFVRHVQARGCIIGSCSDRTLREQSNMWSQVDIVPDFVIAKHRLDSVRERFVSERFVHIGDTQVDAHFADRAGFEFIFVLDLARELASYCEAAGRSGSAPGSFDFTHNGTLSSPEVTPGIKSFW